MMESIEKLRDLLKGCGCSDQCYSCGINFHGSIADEIEAEIAERYMLLPVDADGVPIHVGDTIEYPNGKRDVVRFITVNDNMPTFNERGWVASKCRHIKPRTIEDVLTDLVNEVARQGHQIGLTGHELTMRYADEIRELMEVDR